MNATVGPPGSGISLAPIWTYIYKDIFAENDYNITVYGTWLVCAASYLMVAGFFMIPDVYGRPAWLVKYKVQPGANQPIDTRRLWKATQLSLFNNFLMNLLFLTCLYPLQKRFGCSSHPDHLPTGLKVLLDFTVMRVVDEMGFYYTHRLFHWGPLYRRFHKIHHQWTAPVGVTCDYSHPAEFILSNMLPITCGSVLMGTHLSVLWLWLAQYKYVVVMVHSGYNVPFLVPAEFHDLHHEKFVGNFGGVGYLDFLHGTQLPPRVREPPRVKEPPRVRGQHKKDK